MEKLIDAATFSEALRVIGALVVIAVVLFSGGGLLLWAVNRKAKKADDSRDITNANEGKRIDADGQFRDSLMKRVDNLEAENKVIMAKLMELSTTNATLTAENEHLKADKQQLSEDLKDIRKRNRDLSDRVLELTTLVHRLEIRISELTGKPLEVTLVDGETKVEVVNDHDRSS